MGRIKGWKKLYDWLWEHTNTKNTLELCGIFDPQRNKDTGYYVTVHSSKGELLKQSPDFWTNKKEATKWAVDWMKKHPKGSS